MLKLATVVGARPNLMKAAALLNEMRQTPDIEPLLIHTGQHYDEGMSAVFFRELGIPEPNANLGVGSGSHGVQTGQIMQRLEPLLAGMKPDCVVVVGDVNSTMAAALVSVKLGIPVAHVEAGLRSRDRSMPEEINRIVTDAVSDYLFTTSHDADNNLAHEGIAPDKVFFVGNVMIDTLLACLSRARDASTGARHGLLPGQYAVLTLHRPASVDHAETLAGLVSAVGEIQESLPIIFPIHPRTMQQLEKSGMGDELKSMPHVVITPPLGYLDFIGLLADARLVLTDSGGVQEETTILSVPCITLREHTERPVTITHGTNRLVGLDPQRIVSATREVLAGNLRHTGRPELWDGHAAGRVVKILREKLHPITACIPHTRAAGSQRLGRI